MSEWISSIPWMVLITISLARTTESSICGQLTKENIPQLHNAMASRNWPWHAALYHRSTNNEQPPSYECGGTLISEDWILTAGHCVIKNDEPIEPNEISVLLGRFNLTANESRTEQSFEVYSFEILTLSRSKGL